MRPVKLAAAIFAILTTAHPDNIAFFYALDADLNGLRTRATDVRQFPSSDDRFIRQLSLGSHTIYAIRMGSGSVETAVSAQALLGRVPCDWAFSIGPAGALSDEFQRGAWCRVTRVVAWQHGTVDSTGLSATDGGAWDMNWTDLHVTNFPALFSTVPPIVIASGEAFIASATERDRIRQRTGADAVDMNSFGLAVACHARHIPLLSWKVVSDQADEAAPDSFRSFAASYDGAGGRAIAELVETLPPNPNAPKSYPAIKALLEDTD